MERAAVCPGAGGGSLSLCSLPCQLLWAWGTAERFFHSPQVLRADTGENSFPGQGQGGQVYGPGNKYLAKVVEMAASCDSPDSPQVLNEAWLRPEDLSSHRRGLRHLLGCRWDGARPGQGSGKLGGREARADRPGCWKVAHREHACLAPDFPAMQRQLDHDTGHLPATARGDHPDAVSVTLRGTQPQQKRGSLPVRAICFAERTHTFSAETSG